MKIDLSGFMPDKGAISGLASNINMRDVIEKVSENYVEQIESEASIIENNLQKGSLLYNLWEMLSNTNDIINNDILISLKQKQVSISAPEYIAAYITQDAPIIDFSIYDIVTATHQYVNLKGFRSVSEGFLEDNGIISISPKSFIIHNNGNIDLSQSNTVKSATIRGTEESSVISSNKLSVEHFICVAEDVIIFQIYNEEFLFIITSEIISGPIIFTSSQGNTLEIELFNDIHFNDLIDELNNAFGLNNQVIVQLYENDNLESIIKRINYVSNETGVNAYALRVADNDFNLIIKSNEAGYAFSMYSPLLMTNFEVQDTRKASLVVDSNVVVSSGNELELSTGAIFVTLLKDSLPNKNINLKIEVDKENIYNSLLSLAKSYNEFLDFFVVQTERDYFGNWKETAILRNSNALSLTKSKLSSVFTRTFSGFTLVDFGILFDSKSHLYIDKMKLYTALKEETNYSILENIVKEIAKVIKAVTSYNGVIKTELNQLSSNNSLHTKKIDEIKRRLDGIRQETYKKFSQLEATVANSNYIMKMLEDQMR